MATILQKTVSLTSPVHLEETDNELLEARLTILPPDQRKKVMRHVDRRVVIILAVIYCVCITDRTNLGLAAVAGMSKDLVLIGTRYSIIVLVFFPTYICFQPLATIVIRKIGPRIFLSTICIAWGAVLIGCGFVSSWWQMIPLRLVLGILEAGSFPGSIYLLSSWFCRQEMQTRISYYYMIGMVVSAFAGILAYGLTQMEGTANLRGWRWIFIIEGVITCAVAIIAFWVLVDFPDKAVKSFRFLTVEEADYVVARIEKDRKDVIPEQFNWRSYFANGLDYKIWIYGLIFAFAAVPTYGLTYFMPIILQDGLKYSTAKAQCLTAPPQIASVILMYIEGHFGDKYQVRGVWIAINAVLILIGAPIAGFVTNPGVRYFGVFLAGMGAYPQVPAIISYQATNIRGQWKRAFTSASLIGLSGVGAIAGSLVFRTQDAPNYVPGLIALMVANTLILVLLGGVSVAMSRANSQADAGKRVIEGLSTFRYTL